MTPIRLVLLSAVAAAALGCGTWAAEDRPALIARPTESSRAELLRVVTAAFNGQPVTIADDALTRDSVLIIERREPRDLEGLRFGGRVLEAPQQFRLVLRGSRCELVRPSDGARWRLTEAHCVPNGDSVIEQVRQ